MPRSLALAALLFALVPAVAKSGEAPRFLAPRPVAFTVSSEVVVVGTVTEVAEEPIKAKPHPDGTVEVEYTVFMVKITDPLLGTNKNTTHLKVGVPKGAQYPPNDELKKEGSYLLYLNKLPGGTLLVPAHPPVNQTSRGAEEITRRAKLAAAAVNDPMKALKAKDADDRARAACALALYYRRAPAGGAKSEEVDRPAEESKLLLKVLAEADWTMTGTPDDGNPYSVVFGMGLVEAGWTYPTFAGRDVESAKASFGKWVEATGKDARVKQLVAKK